MAWNDLGVIDVSDNIKGMLRNQLVELFSYTDTRAKKFGEVNGRKLIRNIIYQQWLACQQEVREYKTIRQFWYSYVKPVISEAGLLDSKTDWDNVLSDELGTIVKDYKLCRYGVKLNKGTKTAIGFCPSPKSLLLGRNDLALT